MVVRVSIISVAKIVRNANHCHARMTVNSTVICVLVYVLKDGKAKHATSVMKRRLVKMVVF